MLSMPIKQTSDGISLKARGYKTQLLSPVLYLYLIRHAMLRHVRKARPPALINQSQLTAIYLTLVLHMSLLNQHDPNIIVGAHSTRILDFTPAYLLLPLLMKLLRPLPLLPTKIPHGIPGINGRTTLGSHTPCITCQLFMGPVRIVKLYRQAWISKGKWQANPTIILNILIGVVQMIPRWSTPILQTGTINLSQGATSEVRV
jgi:hypothetical protein